MDYHNPDPSKNIILITGGDIDGFNRLRIPSAIGIMASCPRDIIYGLVDTGSLY